MTYKVSKSLLEKFYSGCPARSDFYLNYKLRVLPKPLRFGIEVHRLVEKGLPEDIFDYEGDVLAVEVADKMLRILEKQGYEVIAQEIWHEGPLTENIDVVGLIDLLAIKDGVPVLVDFKTGGRQWDTITTDQGEIIVPNSAGFQGPCYLTPPYKDPYFDGDWPTRLDYIMVPNDGVSKVYTFYENGWSRQNLVLAAEQYVAAKEAGPMVKNVGYQCKRCDWRFVCWQTPVWESRYTPRREIEIDDEEEDA